MQGLKASTRQHELDHIDHDSICPERSRSIGYLSYLWTLPIWRVDPINQALLACSTPCIGQHAPDMLLTPSPICNVASSAYMLNPVYRSACPVYAADPITNMQRRANTFRPRIKSAIRTKNIDTIDLRWEPGATRMQNLKLPHSPPSHHRNLVNALCPFGPKPS